MDQLKALWAALDMPIKVILIIAVLAILFG